MGYHILHIFQHGAVLAKEQGFIVCRDGAKGEKRLPYQDLRAVIVVARGVTLTSSFLSAVGPNCDQGNREIDPQMPEQVEFWE